MNIDNIKRLVEFIEKNSPLFVLTGAGCSTAAGIPDYRDDEGQWKIQPPVQFKDFSEKTCTRKRYWARSMRGWPHINNAEPAAVHHALCKLEQAGIIQYLVTQNVDGLHQKAGASKVLELHGNLNTVCCLNCSFELSRRFIQQQLVDANPEFNSEQSVIRPDGDAQTETDDFSSFSLMSCPQCQGLLKPDVVFFGESVPKNRVALAMQHLQASKAMLVVGSSLMVFSAYRFCRSAKAANKHICAVNRGKTRADEDLRMKIEADCSAVLTQAVTMLGL